MDEAIDTNSIQKFIIHLQKVDAEISSERVFVTSKELTRLYDLYFLNLSKVTHDPAIVRDAVTKVLGASSVGTNMMTKKLVPGHWLNVNEHVSVWMNSDANNESDTMSNTVDISKLDSGTALKMSKEGEIHRNNMIEKLRTEETRKDYNSCMRDIIRVTKNGETNVEVQVYGGVEEVKKLVEARGFRCKDARRFDHIKISWDHESTTKKRKTSQTE